MSSMSDRPRRPKGLPARVAGTWMPMEATGAHDLIPPPDEPPDDMWDPAWDAPVDPWACDPAVDPHGFDAPPAESAPDRDGPPAAWGLDMSLLRTRCETYLDIRHSFDPIRIIRRDGHTIVTARDLDSRGRERTFDITTDDFGLPDGTEITRDGDTWTRTVTLPAPPAPESAAAPPPPATPAGRRPAAPAHPAARTRTAGRRGGRLAVMLAAVVGFAAGMRRTLRRALDVALR